MLPKKCFFFLLILGVSLSIHSQKNIKLKGLIVDENNEPVPYAAVGIISKSIGVATTDEGTFYLLVSKSNLLDILEISCIGFETFKIKVQDFINQKEKKIIIKESVTSLDEIVLISINPINYVKQAIRRLRKTTINKKHQLNILYRRFSLEDNKARFLVEHYINVLDNGPIEAKFLGVNVVTGRKSADYRFVKVKKIGHPIHVLNTSSPLRNGFGLKNYNWKRIGNTSYDGEDVIIVEGRDKKNKKDFLRFYVGMETYGVYKIETSQLNAIYIYKKDDEGKLHLSYHNRTRKGNVKLTEIQKRILKTNNNVISEAYRHEVFVLGIEKDNDKINVYKYKDFNKDIADISFNYNAEFWQNLSLPPATEYYKNSVKELESNYGVDIETQFKLVNK